MGVNCCEACIAWKIHHKQAEAYMCRKCGRKTLVWHQSSFGTFYLECPHCHGNVAVDLNTPCEQDPVFRRPVQLVIDPQWVLPDNRGILELAKQFGLNSVQMRKRLLQGWTEEVRIDKIGGISAMLDRYAVSRRFVDFEDPRERYPYFEKCCYPYSQMRIFKEVAHDEDP